MGIIFGSARIDENGNIVGGAAGDQTGQEVSTQGYYMHAKGWYCLRPKSADVANKIATAMQQACDNNNIGYDQNQHGSVISYVRRYGSLGAIPVKCEDDCSGLVRACIYQATGRDVGDIYTGNLASVLEQSGLFEGRFSVSSEAQLYNGDVLVTKSTGHTVVVVSGRPRSGGGSTETWKATGTATCTADKVNVRAGAGSNYASYGYLYKGNRFEIDGKVSGDWVHINVAGIGIGYVYKDYVKYDSTPAPAPTPTPSTWKATGTATCTDNDVNVRSTPDGTIIGQLGKGNRFEVDGKIESGWVHVNVAGIGVGYVYGQYVKYDNASSSTPSPAPSTWKATGTATCTENEVNVRSGAGMEHSVIGEVNKGNRFEVDGKVEGDWVHVNVAGIGVGYVAKKYVKYDVVWNATGTATSTDNDVNVRETPDGKIVGVVNKGNRFEVDGKVESGWVHVKVVGIGIGYIYKDYVRYDG